MTVQELLDLGYEDFVTFENPSFDGCIVGITTDNQAIYSLSQMIDWYMKQEKCSYEDALDFISYNTIRILIYTKNHPIVMDDLNQN